jgi:hypothetical protein
LPIDPDQSPIPEPEAEPQGEPTPPTVPSPAPEPELPNPGTPPQNEPVEAKVAPDSEPDDPEIRELDPELRRGSRIWVPTVPFNKRHYARSAISKLTIPETYKQAISDPLHRTH